MALNPAIMQAVEQLNYRVTVGDIATQAGLDINIAQSGLLALASDAGGHLQVAESGDIAYLFPKNFRTILRNKSWRLRWQETWQKIWKVLFYLIRISFGILLIVSIILIVVAIAAIALSLSASSDRDSGDRGGGGRGGLFFLPRILFFPDLFWIFSPRYYDNVPYQRQRQSGGYTRNREMNFLEAIFSFLFGDGNPNRDLEARRWQEIGQVIRHSGGAVVAEEIAPYMGEVDAEEDFMLPVLSRFNGYPKVSPTGEIIYYFPELQVTAIEKQPRMMSNYLHEYKWQFSRATTGQRFLAVGLGAANLIGALVLGSLLAGGELAATLGGLVGFVASIYWLLLAYAIGFLVIPLGRYFWIQQKNPKIEGRNRMRRDRAQKLHTATPELQHKIAYARQFSDQKAVSSEDLAYTTETELLDQNLERSDKIDEEWQRRLDSES